MFYTFKMVAKLIHTIVYLFQGGQFYFLEHVAG